MVNDLIRCRALAVRPTMKAVQKILFWEANCNSPLQHHTGTSNKD